MPAFVVALGIIVLGFWSAAGLLPGPGSSIWPSSGMVVAGLVVGAALVLGGALLGLLATVLPVKFVGASAQALAAAIEDARVRDANLKALEDDH